MMIVLKLAAFAVLMLLLPIGVGLCVAGKDVRQMQHVYFCGLCTMFTGFELLAILFTYKNWPLNVLGGIWLGGMALLSMVGLVWNGRRLAQGKLAGSLGRDVFTNRVLLAAVLLILLQAVLAVALTYMNWDDSSYNATALAAYSTNTVGQFDEYTGEQIINPLKTERGLAPWPIFWAMLAQMLHIHPTILMHSILPAFMVPLAYYVYYQLALELTNQNKTRAGWIMLFLGGMTLFSGYSTVLRAWWLLSVSWMGKSVLGSIFCPLLVYEMMQIAHTREPRQRRMLWREMLLCVISACLASSSAFATVPILLGCYGLAYLIRTRDFSCIWKLAICVAPCFAMGLYAIL